MSARRWKFLCCIASAALTVSGCAALGGDQQAEGGGSGGLEKISITIAAISSVDAAPLWMAQDLGYFKAEGLDVKTVLAKDGATSQTKVISGEADIAETTYPLLFVSQQSGAVDLRLVADGTSASHRSNQLVTVPNSSVKTVNDLPGKRIAITSKNATSQILTQSVMKDHGLDYSHVDWVPVPLPEMAEQLRLGRIDAAYLPEPFITKAAHTVGATTVIDVATGSTQDFPILGYAAKREWTEKYPQTMSAFQRAMLKATRAAVDRAKWEPLVVKYANVEAGDASLMTPPGFGSILDARRIQRVPDLLEQLGILPGHFDAASMIAKQVSS